MARTFAVNNVWRRHLVWVRTWSAFHQQSRLGRPDRWRKSWRLEAVPRVRSMLITSLRITFIFKNPAIVDFWNECVLTILILFPPVNVSWASMYNVFLLVFYLLYKLALAETRSLRISTISWATVYAASSVPSNQLRLTCALSQLLSNTLPLSTNSKQFFLVQLLKILVLNTSQAFLRRQRMANFAWTRHHARTAISQCKVILLFFIDSGRQGRRLIRFVSVLFGL